MRFLLLDFAVDVVRALRRDADVREPAVDGMGVMYKAWLSGSACASISLTWLLSFSSLASSLSPERKWIGVSGFSVYFSRIERGLYVQLLKRGRHKSIH